MKVHTLKGWTFVRPFIVRNREMRKLLIVMGCVFGAVLVVCGLISLTNFVTDDSGQYDDPPAFAPREQAGSSNKVVKSSFGPGYFLVGVDIQPGTYKTRGARDSMVPICVWTVNESDDQDANLVEAGSVEKANEPGRVTVKKNQVIETSGCYEWIKQ